VVGRLGSGCFIELSIHSDSPFRSSFITGIAPPSCPTIRAEHRLSGQNNRDRRRLCGDDSAPVWSPPAQRGGGRDQNVSGTWTLSAEGYVLPMTLHQDRTRLPGTLHGPHGPFPLVGEFKKGRIHLAGTADGAGIRHDDDSIEIDVAAIGRLQPDGFLAGTMVSNGRGLYLAGDSKGFGTGPTPRMKCLVLSNAVW
jgi:hypothetical protein